MIKGSACGCSRRSSRAWPVSACSTYSRTGVQGGRLTAAWGKAPTRTCDGRLLAALDGVGLHQLAAVADDVLAQIVHALALHVSGGWSAQVVALVARDVRAGLLRARRGWRGAMPMADDNAATRKQEHRCAQYQHSC